MKVRNVHFSNNETAQKLNGDFGSYDITNAPNAMRTYNLLDEAFRFFNIELFGGILPTCLIIFQRTRKNYGYFPEALGEHKQQCGGHLRNRAQSKIFPRENANGSHGDVCPRANSPLASQFR